MAQAVCRDVGNVFVSTDSLWRSGCFKTRCLCQLGFAGGGTWHYGDGSDLFYGGSKWCSSKPGCNTCICLEVPFSLEKSSNLSTGPAGGRNPCWTFPKKN